MDLYNTENKATQHFDFGTIADSTASAKKRNIRSEISNKGFDPESVIDAFEASKGIKRKNPNQELNNFQFKNIILDPEQQRDQDLLNELMNNPNYMITFWKDSWTPQGNYRVFIIYGTKKEKEKQ